MLTDFYCICLSINTFRIFQIICATRCVMIWKTLKFCSKYVSSAGCANLIYYGSATFPKRLIKHYFLYNLVLFITYP